MSPPEHPGRDGEPRPPLSNDDPRIARIAANVADARDVDWQDLHRSLPELTPILQQLATIDEIATRHRRIEPLPPGAHSGPLGTISGDGWSSGDTAATPAIAPETLARWGQLEIREKIGEGTFGEVFRAYDPSLQRDVALKLARPPGGGRTGTPENLHLEEARRLASVRHPNVLTIHGVETHGGRTGMWTDLLQGLTLAEMFEQEEMLSAQELLRIGIQLCRALQAIHEAGLVHGDVKAANVVSEPDGRVVLMDFGAGRRLSPSESAETGSTDELLFGTPIVLAPEVLEGGAQTISGDLYSLGVLLYRGAAGRYPVEASSIVDLVLEHRRTKPIPLGELRPDLPEVVTRAVDRTISRDPAGRFESAAAMEASLAISAGPETEVPLESWAGDLPEGVPEEPTRFLGREEELAAIQARLDHGGYVTLVGPGGTGKTRLAVEVARRLARRYRGGVRWIDLARILSPAGFLPGVAAQLGVRARPNQSDADALNERLRTESVLLILDNAEHVVEPAREWIADIVRACPRVVLLVTCREPLGWGGEAVQEIEPLGVPPEKGDSTGGTAGRAADISSSESVRLFVDRAVLARRSFRLTASRLEAVARIVRLVDGIPLAIELAAARAASMDVEEIASRLERNAAVLAEPGRQVPRHRSMDAALEWSWGLLSPAEQALLRRLSVFRGGATPAAIEHVTADPPAGSVETDWVPLPRKLGPGDGDPELVLSPEDARIEGEEIFLVLDGLVRRSLVRVERGRYRLYEVVRQFAEGKLRSSGELESLRRAYVRYYVVLSVEAEGRLYGDEQTRWYALFAEESTNFEAALAIALGTEAESGAGLRLAAALGRHWARLGQFSLGLSHLQEQLERAGREPTAHRAHALNWAGNMAFAVGDYAAAARFHEEGEAVERARGDTPGIGIALGGLGDALWRMGETERARACLEECVEIQRAAGRPIQLSQALTKLAIFSHYQDEWEKARALHEESLSLQRERGDDAGTALSLSGLGAVFLLQKKHARALECFTEALALRRKLGDRLYISTSLNGIANALIEMGRLDEALDHAREALRIQESARRPLGVCHFFDVLGMHAERGGRPRDALALISAICAVRESTGEILPAGERRALDERAERLRAALSDEEAREAWLSGQVMTLDDALGFGFSYLERV